MQVSVFVIGCFAEEFVSCDVCVWQERMWDFAGLTNLLSDRTCLGGLDSKHRGSLPGQLSEDLFSSTPVCCGHTLRKYAAFTKHYLTDIYCVLVSNCIKPSQICGSTWEFNYVQQPPSLPDLSVNLACCFYGQHLLAPLSFLLLLLVYVNFHLHELMFV